jgi:hypothetical protein
MGKPLVGEVVVLPFPQTNLQSGKRRPALVVVGYELDFFALAFLLLLAQLDFKY